MIFDGLLSFFVALVGLGILVLIHEFGHYLMARRAGMRVEMFGIGFGRPMFSFMHNGVQFNVCWIPFGGYVKIAGMEGKGYEAPDGFFAKSPLARMKVAICGPLANLLFALFAFSVIWLSGGREEPFSDVTARVGWVDTNSDLYAKGVRPGDLVLAYNGSPIHGAKDHFYAAMTSGPKVKVEVETLRPFKENGRILQTEARVYQHPFALEKGILTAGILAPANFLVWNPPAGTPLSAAEKESGILPGDRIVWVDGELIFSQLQLNAILNDKCLLVTVVRDGTFKQLHVPRLPVSEIKITPEVKGELSDWLYESKLPSTKLNNLWFLPYNLTSDGVVEAELPLFDEKAIKLPYTDHLLPNDRIVAVENQPVATGAQILTAFQEKHVLVIVDRSTGKQVFPSYENADGLFSDAYHSPNLAEIIQSIGTQHAVMQSGSFVLLNPIAPKTRRELLEASGQKEEVVALRAEEQKSLQAIEDPQLRRVAEQNFLARDKQLFLGLYGVHDIEVMYNPSPIAMCESIVKEVKQTVSALLGGYLSPKWMAGPVGILHVIQEQWSIGYKEALFWLGMISLNLAILNLVPLPVLDGGYILFSLFEMVTGIRLKPETMEKIILPFAVILVLFFLYLTYHDVMRLFSHLWSSWRSG